MTELSGASNAHTPLAGDDGTRHALLRINQLHTQWRRLHRLWWGLHYFCGISGIVAGVIAGTSAGEGEADNWRWLAGVLAAVATSLVTFLGPLQKAERYWRGFHRVDQALLEFESSMISIEELNIAVRMSRDGVVSGAVSEKSKR